MLLATLRLPFSALQPARAAWHHWARLLLCVGGSTAFAFAGAPSGPSSPVEIIPTPGRNSYRLATAQLDGPTAPLAYIASTYDQVLCAFTDQGQPRWHRPTAGFLFDLATGDIDGDGRDEIAAAGSDGCVYLFGADGTLRWQQALGAPVYQVCFARLESGLPVVLAGGISRRVVAFSATGQSTAQADVDGMIRILRAGDFDGDGRDEVAALVIRGQQQNICFFSGPKLARRSETIGRGKNGGDPLLSLRPANGLAADLNGDGAAEFIYPAGVYTLRGGVKRLLPGPERFRPGGYDSHYNMRQFAVGNLVGGPEPEWIVAEGPELRLYDHTGRELGRATAPFGFTALTYVPGSPHGSILLGSSPNGDENLYRITFAAGWEKAFARLERRGAMARIGNELQRIATAAARWQGEPMLGTDGPYDVIVNHTMWSGWSPQKFTTWIEEVRLYQNRFPSTRLRFATAFWPGEKAPLLRPDGQPWPRDRRLAHDLTREQIVAAARHFEQQRCPFWIQVGHGCGPHLELATVAAALQAAPKMLLGFISAEDEQPELMDYYFEHYLKPVLELSLAHGKHVILRNKNIWWARWPAEGKLRQMIFNGRYRAVLLPCVEDSNSRSPDVSLAARLGLWLDGQVDDWASRSCADWFSFNRSWEWEYPMTGHPHLRYYVSQALLGARVFMLLNGERSRSAADWSRVGAEGTVPFLDLLARGAITPPKRAQVQGISPVALLMQNPSRRFGEHGANGHNDAGWNRDPSDTQAWAFDRLDAYWGMAPLPDTDVATYLWGRARRDPSHLPITTPHGLVALLPGRLADPNPRWTSLWTTDGDQLRQGERGYSLTAGRAALQADLRAGTAAQPWIVSGAIFHQVVAQTPDHYVLALVDPGWVVPQDRLVQLRTTLPGAWRLRDRLTGQDLGPLDPTQTLVIPAGTLRLLDLRRGERPTSP